MQHWIANFERIKWLEESHPPSEPSCHCVMWIGATIVSQPTTGPTHSPGAFGQCNNMNLNSKGHKMSQVTEGLSPNCYMHVHLHFCFRHLMRLFYPSDWILAAATPKPSGVIVLRNMSWVSFLSWLSCQLAAADPVGKPFQDKLTKCKGHFALHIYHVTATSLNMFRILLEFIDLAS